MTKADTTAKRKRTNWSKGDNLKLLTECINELDVFREREHKKVCIKSFYRERVQHKGIPPGTFYYYGRMDVSKRRKLGAQVGPKVNDNVLDQELLECYALDDDDDDDDSEPRHAHCHMRFDDDNHEDFVVHHEEEQQLQQQQQIDMACVRLARETMSNWYNFLQSSSVASQQVQLQQQQLVDAANEQQCYRHIADSLCRADIPRTAAERKARREFWERALPRACNVAMAGDDFLKVEQDLLHRCNETYGSAQVEYLGPLLNGDGTIDDTQTDERRLSLKADLRLFELVRARHETAMMHSDSALIAATDYLLSQHDQDRQTMGMDPSGLRWRLQESNHLMQKKLTKRRKAGGSGARDHEANDIENQTDVSNGITNDLSLPPEIHAALFRRIRAQMRTEENSLNPSIK
jgi:hypothetical protein